MPRRTRNREIPKPPIAEVLAEITGCDVADIPTGYGWVRMHCVFHEDRTKSAGVNHEVGGFACHSCSRRGDGLKLLQTELGLDFKSACEKAEQLGGVVEKARPKRRASDLLRNQA